MDNIDSLYCQIWIVFIVSKGKLYQVIIVIKIFCNFEIPGISLHVKTI